MPVTGDNAATMIDFYKVAVSTCPAAVDYPARGHRIDRRTGSARQIDPRMGAKAAVNRIYAQTETGRYSYMKRQRKCSCASRGPADRCFQRHKVGFIGRSNVWKGFGPRKIVARGQ